MSAKPWIYLILAIKWWEHFVTASAQRDLSWSVSIYQYWLIDNWFLRVLSDIAGIECCCIGCVCGSLSLWSFTTSWSRRVKPTLLTLSVRCHQYDSHQMQLRTSQMTASIRTGNWTSNGESLCMDYTSHTLLVPSFLACTTRSHCIVPNVDISLQSGRFWAMTIASFGEGYWILGPAG